jgi:excisionase family DNA binding protein
MLSQSTLLHTAVTVPPADGALVVSPQKACQLLDCGITRLYELINEGELVSYKDGRARRITMDSIRARVQRLIEASRPGA